MAKSRLPLSNLQTLNFHLPSLKESAKTILKYSCLHSDPLKADMDYIGTMEKYLLVLVFVLRLYPCHSGSLRYIVVQLAVEVVWT